MCMLKQETYHYGDNYRTNFSLAGSGERSVLQELVHCLIHIDDATMTQEQRTVESPQEPDTHLLCNCSLPLFTNLLALMPMYFLVPKDRWVNLFIKWTDYSDDVRCFKLHAHAPIEVITRSQEDRPEFLSEAFWLSFMLQTSTYSCPRKPAELRNGRWWW